MKVKEFIDQLHEQKSVPCSLISGFLLYKHDCSRPAWSGHVNLAAVKVALQ